MRFEEIAFIYAGKYPTASQKYVKCKCPVHDDQQASLSIRRENGRTGVKCHAGCETENVLQAKGLSIKDLYENPSYSNDWRVNYENWLRSCKHPIEGFEQSTLCVADVYDYLDESGKYLYSRVRIHGKRKSDGKQDKTMRYLQIDHSTGRYSMGDGKQPHVLYNLPALVKADPDTTIYYVEGEKDVLTMQSYGYIAVTAGAVDDWKTDFSEHFRNRNVVILPDNDKPGETLAQKVKTDILPVVQSLKVITVSQIEKGDITDFFEKENGTKEDFDRLVFETAEEPKANGWEDKPRELPPEELLARFCRISREGNPYDIIPERIYQYLLQHDYQGNRIKFVNGLPYVYSGGTFVNDDLQVRSTIRKLIYPDLIEYARVNRVFQLLSIDKNLSVDFQDMNQYPESWVIFRNGALDVETMQMYHHSPKYLAVNQIPHNYDENAVYEGSVADRFFRGLVPDTEDRQMLFRFFGLCFSRDTSAQKFLILAGLPGTGKSECLSFLSSCIGSPNISNVSLQDLNKRFYPSLLFGKLLNVCADLSKNAMEATDEIKKIVGEDVILNEKKGVDAFPFKSYSKLIFSANVLPSVLDEKSEAFFRRLLIVSIQHKPPFIENLRQGLQESIPGFINECMRELHEWYADGKPALDSRRSVEAVQQYYRDADSVRGFLDQFDHFSNGARLKGSEVYDAYRIFCTREELQYLTRKSFFRDLRSKGFTEQKIHGYSYFTASDLGDDHIQMVTLSPPNDMISSPSKVILTAVGEVGEDWENPFT